MTIVAHVVAGIPASALDEEVVTRELTHYNRETGAPYPVYVPDYYYQIKGERATAEEARGILKEAGLDEYPPPDSDDIPKDSVLGISVCAYDDYGGPAPMPGESAAGPIKKKAAAAAKALGIEHKVSLYLIAYGE